MILKLTTTKLLVLLIIFTTASFCPATSPESRGKQKKYFPKIIKDSKIYFGMSEEKFTSKIKNTIPQKDGDFRTIYIVPQQDSEIENITYYFTTTTTPQLYEFIIKYKDMNGVLPRAKTILGEPNHKGEWRISKKTIKEDFMMAVWTFGHKIVYAVNLKGSEWEQGF